MLKLTYVSCRSRVQIESCLSSSSKQNYKYAMYKGVMHVQLKFGIPMCLRFSFIRFYMRTIDGHKQHKFYQVVKEERH